MRKKREITVDGDIARVPLTRGYTAIVDAADVHLVEGYNWTVNIMACGSVYAFRKERMNGKQCIVMMHRAVLGISGFSVKVDHRDKDGLNNRRYNLRKSTNAENGCNRGAQKNNKIGLKGVSEHKGAWRAHIASKGVKKYLGRFATPEAAHSAYCAAVSTMHGEFARVQ